MLNGLVLVPHAIAVNETVVEVFDPLCHEQLAFSNPPRPAMLDQGFDPRYVPANARSCSPAANFRPTCWSCSSTPRPRSYSAPIQLKANNGFLLIDDLGRQRIEPTRALQPLDRADGLAAGLAGYESRAIISAVPFDLVLVFSTNLRPEDIADQAFLRRLGYKIEFLPVQPGSTSRSGSASAPRRSTAYDGGLVDYVIEQLHRRRHVPLLPCHPRDLVGMALDRVTYLGRGRLDTETPALGLGQLFPSPGSNEFGTTESIRE